MSDQFVPYSEIAPHTDSLPALTAELERCREQHGRRSSQALEAYLRLSHAAALKQEHGLGALRHHCENESERFFSFCIPGPDGHTYWDGAASFIRNDGTMRKPIRWWWELRHDVALINGDALGPVCGEPACITPEHAAMVSRSERRKVFSDAELIGAIQVWALREGRSPSKESWDNSPHPAGMSAAAISLRFGTWNRALETAGLRAYTVPAAVTVLTCIKAIRFARGLLNRWPSMHDLSQPWMRERLRAEGFPQRSTIFNRLGGSWAEALRRAGKR